VNEAMPRPERGGPRGGQGPRGGGRGGAGRGRGGFSRDDYRDSARQPKEPRW
jgi:hypothetical protein